MIARQWVGAAVTVAGILLAGCQSPPPPSSLSTAQRTAPPVAPAPTFVTPDQTAEPPAPDSTAALSQALSRKTAEYAKAMDAAPAARPKAPADSSVQWGQPHTAAPDATVRPHIASAANTPASLQPAPSPAANNATPTPTQATALARSAKANPLGDVPAIEPESSDFDSGSAHPAAASIGPAPDSVESQVAQRVKEDPHDVAAQLDNQLLLMMKDQAAPQLASMPQLSTEDQELVNTLVDGLTNFRTAVRQDENMLLSSKIKPLLDMADRLRAQAELTVSTVALCRNVKGFGNYDTINPPRFPAGQENDFIVYCEIQNFASRHDADDKWTTRLSQRVTLFNETGMLVWKDKPQDVNDTCRNRRHDFFSFDIVRLPANVSIGRYILKVTIIDRTANRVAEKTVPLEISAGAGGDFDDSSNTPATNNNSSQQPATPAPISPLTENP